MAECSPGTLLPLYVNVQPINQPPTNADLLHSVTNRNLTRPHSTTPLDPPSLRSHLNISLLVCLCCVASCWAIRQSHQRTMCADTRMLVHSFPSLAPTPIQTHVWELAVQTACSAPKGHPPSQNLYQFAAVDRLPKRCLQGNLTTATRDQEGANMSRQSQAKPQPDWMESTMTISLSYHIRQIARQRKNQI